GIVSVSFYVYRGTASDDLEVLANTNVALSTSATNTSVITKTVPLSAANFATNTNSVSNSWAGSYYGTIASNIANTSQSLTAVGTWQQVSFTTNIASG